MRNAFWAIVSQVSSSVGNLLLAVLVAREATVPMFAGFALSVPVYITFQRFSRVLLLVPRQIEESRGAAAVVRWTPGFALSATFALSLLTMVVMLLVALAVPPNFQIWLTVLALSMPGLALFDVVRNEYLAEKSMSRVAMMDGSWLAGQVAISALVVVFADAPWLYLVAWGLIATVVGGVAHRCRRERMPTPSDAFVGLRLSKKFLSDALTDLWGSVLVFQAIPYLIAGLLSAAGAAAFRGAQMLFGPVNVVIMGLLPLLQMRTAGFVGEPRQVRLVTCVASGALVAVCAIYAVPLVLMPASFGEQLLGDTWQSASELLPGLAVLTVVRTPMLVVTTSLRSLGERGLLSGCRLLSSSLTIVAAILGALLHGLTAVPWAMAIAAGVSGLVAGLAFWHVTGRRRRTDFKGGVVG